MKNWKRAENSPRERSPDKVRVRGREEAARRGAVGDFNLKAVPFLFPQSPFFADVAKENGAISAQAIDLILMTDAVLTRQQSRLSPP